MSFVWNRTVLTSIVSLGALFFDTSSKRFKYCYEQSKITARKKKFKK